MAILKSLVDGDAQMRTIASFNSIKRVGTHEKRDRWQHSRSALLRNTLKTDGTFEDYSFLLDEPHTEITLQHSRCAAELGKDEEQEPILNQILEAMGTMFADILRGIALLRAYRLPREWYYGYIKPQKWTRVY